jgi:hypothetical protein
MEKEKTAVQYLYENYIDNPLTNEDVIYNSRVIEKAKEMERRQMIIAYQCGHGDQDDDTIYKFAVNHYQDNYINH